jgi:hypothetical protein
MIAFLRSREQLENIDADDEVAQDTLTMLASFDIPAYILNRKTPYHRLWAQYNLDQAGIEDESGLPCSLVDLLAQLDHFKTIDALFKWQVPTGDLAQIYSWEATRYAAIVRVLEDFKAAHELDITTFLQSNGSSFGGLVHLILSSVQQCLLHLLPESSQFKQTLVFPLVMAASLRSHLSDQARDFISSTIQSLASEGNYYLRQGVLRVIQEHWSNDANTIEETARRMDIELAMW